MRHRKLNPDTAGRDVLSHIKSGRSKAAVRGTLWSGLNAVIPVVLNGAVFIISSRFLTPTDFGIVALTVSIVMCVSALAPASYGEALVQLPKLRQSHLDSVFWLCAVTAAFLYTILVIFTPLVGRLSGHTAIEAFLPLIAIRLIFDSVAVVPTALIARSMAFHVLALKTSLATLVACGICVILLINGYGIWALAISQVSASAVNAIAALVGAAWRPGRQVRAEAVGELSRYGLFASGNRLLQIMNLDQILIGTLMGALSLGFFNFARRLFQMLSDVIAGALGSVAYPLFSSLQHEPAKLREAFLTATFGSAIICFPAFMGLGAIAAMGIPLVFGPQWIPAIGATRWFCAIGLMSCIGVVQSSFINSQGKANWWFYYQLLRQAVGIATIIVLRHASLSTLVMVMAIQYYLFWPISTLMVSNLIDVKITRYLRQFLEPLIASLIMLGTILFIETLTVSLYVPLRILIDILSGGAIYGMLLLLMCRQRLFSVTRLLFKRSASPRS